MKRRILLVMAVVVLISGGGVWAWARLSPALHENLAAKAVEASVNARTYLILEYSLLHFSALDENTPDSAEQRARSSELVDHLFNSEQATETLNRYLATHCDNSTLHAVLKWYNSPLGKRINKAERTITESNTAYFDRYLSELEKNPLPKKRVALMKKFAAKSGYEERMQRLIQQGMKSFDKGYASPSATMAKRQRPDRLSDSELQEWLHKSLWDSYLYVYRTLSPQEMELYMQFLSSKEYRSFEKQLVAGIGKAFDEAFYKVGRERAELAKRSEESSAGEAGREDNETIEESGAANQCKAE